jgi:hypothetical protein
VHDPYQLFLLAFLLGLKEMKALNARYFAVRGNFPQRAVSEEYSRKDAKAQRKTQRQVHYFVVREFAERFAVFFAPLREYFF